MTKDETIDVREAAKLLGMREQSTYVAIRERRLPAEKVDGVWRIPASSIKEFREKREAAK